MGHCIALVRPGLPGATRVAGWIGVFGISVGFHTLGIPLAAYLAHETAAATLQVRRVPDDASIDLELVQPKVSEMPPRRRAQGRDVLPTAAATPAPDAPKPQSMVVPPAAREKTPPPLPEVDRQRMKRVMLDAPATALPPVDARYLSDQNRRVERETRALRTALMPTDAEDHAREQVGASATEGGADSPHVPRQARPRAEQARASQGPEALPQKGLVRPSPSHPKAPSLEPPRPTPAHARQRQPLRQLSMRMNSTRGAPALAQRASDAAGELALSAKPLSAVDSRPSSVRPRLWSFGAQPPARPLAPAAQGLAEGVLENGARVHGGQHALQRGNAAAAAGVPSDEPAGSGDGRRAKKWRRIRAALESFVPEVRPGNQTALGTRADPFASYLVRAHERIHALWGYGFLVELDTKPDSHPMNNMQLVTTVEMAIDVDGLVSRATIVHPSGNLSFDVAALDTAFAAEPYPESPQVIRSFDGKVYLHWRFYRDDRQCGTFGVDPFILSKAPSSSRAARR